MRLAEYLLEEIGKDRVMVLVRAGLFSLNLLTWLDIYEWHNEHNKDREQTAKHFHISVYAVSYAIGKLRKKIV